VPWKHYKAVTRDLKAIYQAPTEEQVLAELSRFKEAWDDQFPQVGRSWTNNWARLRTLFEYPPEIRKAIYTTDAIESLNSEIRKATRNRKVSPTDQSTMKVTFLAILNALKNWKRPIHNWKEALNRFSIQFEERPTSTDGVYTDSKTVSLRTEQKKLMNSDWCAASNSVSMTFR